MSGSCDRCGKPIDIAGVGRTPRFCSNACRQAAYRDRRPRLPHALTDSARWVRHIAKRPVTVSGAPASSTDPQTWSTHADAVRSDIGDGLGFVLGAGVACIDIDHCLLSDGSLNRVAVDLLCRFPGAYVEISPSGTGLHLWGTAPEQKGRKRGGFEVYSVGRYITVTGNAYRAGGLPDLSSAF